MFKLISNYKKYIFVLVFVAIAIAGLLTAKRFVIVNNISCDTQYGPCPDDYMSSLNSHLGSNYFEAKPAIQEYLNSTNSVNKFTIKFNLPDKVNISIIQKKPKFGISKEVGPVALVDGDGRVLSYQDETLLPILFTEVAPPAVGENVDSSVQFALDLLLYMNTLYDVRSAYLSSDAISMSIFGGTKFVYPKEGEARELIGATILISSKLGGVSENVLNNKAQETRMENEIELGSCASTCVIDLRYANPVVKL